MPSLTKSEKLFADLCAARHVQYARLPESDTRTADYKLVLQQAELYAEVKQLDPSERDQRASEKMRAGDVALGMAPTRRVRDQIAKAYNQLKGYAKRGHPCIIVLFNNAGILNHIDSFTMTSAMFGGFGVRLALDDSRTVRHVGQGFTGERKLTRNTCRGISAVCVLERTAPKESSLTAYHNPFATHPIPPRVLASLATKQLRHDDPHVGQFVPLLPREIAV